MNRQDYQEEFPVHRPINVGSITSPRVFIVESMSVFGLMKICWQIAEKTKRRGAVVDQNSVGRIISTHGREIFDQWGPEALVEPRIYATREDAAKDGLDPEVDDKDREYWLTSDVHDTHILKLLGGVLEDGGGGQMAASFRQVGDGGRSGSDVEGARNPSE